MFYFFSWWELFCCWVLSRWFPSPAKNGSSRCIRSDRGAKRCSWPWIPLWNLTSPTPLHQTSPTCLCRRGRTCEETPRVPLCCFQIPVLTRFILQSWVKASEIWNQWCAVRLGLSPAWMHFGWEEGPHLADYPLHGSNSFPETMAIFFYRLWRLKKGVNMSW